MIKKIFISLGITATLLMIILAVVDMYKREKSIKKNEYETVAKVYKYYSNRSNSRYYYEYFYHGKKYQNDEDIDNGNQEECVNKYYKLELSTENPQFSEIYLEEEIVDSLKIKEAGFE